MEGHVVRRAHGGEGERVEEKEAEDDKNAAQDAPPQLLVHGLFSLLLALSEVLKRKIKRV
jgi:hypothetical protein